MFSAHYVKPVLVALFAYLKKYVSLNILCLKSTMLYSAHVQILRGQVLCV